MKRFFGACLLIFLGIGVAGAEDSKPPAFGYTSSGSCIASSLGFTSELEPINPGVSWRTTFNAVGSADADGNVIEAGQSVDSASFGAGPRMHSPAANAYRDSFVATLTGPNADGSSSFRLGLASGAFVAGPNAGVRFTISNFELRGGRDPAVSKPTEAARRQRFKQSHFRTAQSFSGFVQCLSS